MEGKIPVPTDNIFKFYALFSLLIFVFCWGTLIFVNQSTNRTVFASVIELQELESLQDPSPVDEAKSAILKRQLEIAKADKRFYVALLGALSGLSVLGGFYGFRRWHSELQPLVDETARVQLEIAKLQLAKLRAEVERKQS
ncbi:hypothetical protein [Pseudomonas subflava]|uniref:hypothetical protein n=1 Tax=Pseudomonas subflava TaxID=2952933 RepID=UPI00207A2D2D|nr:hypothetical protein [Pseudomonas subflava]